MLLMAETSGSLITDALANVSSVVSTGTEIVTGNPVAMVFIGLSLAGVGIAFFKKLTRKK